MPVSEKELNALSTDGPKDGEAVSVGQRVLSVLRREIITTHLEPGQVIKEAEIAARLGVSKTPVREALQTLFAEDFVMAFPRRGYVVRPVGLNDIRDIMDLRLAIEPPLTGVAARQSTPALVQQLHKILGGQLDSGSNYAQRLDAASEFHRAIAATARNGRADRLLRTYFDETTRMHYLFERVREHVVSEDELRAHRAILDAIEMKDEARAQQEMISHLQESNEALLRSFY